MSIMRIANFFTNKSAGFGFFEDNLKDAYFFNLAKDKGEFIWVDISDMKTLIGALGVIEHLQSNTDIKDHTVCVSNRLHLVWEGHRLSLRDTVRKATVELGMPAMMGIEQRKKALSWVISETQSLLLGLYHMGVDGNTLKTLLHRMDEINATSKGNVHTSVFDCAGRGSDRNLANFSISRIVAPSQSNDTGMVISFGNINGCYHRYFPKVDQVKELKDVLCMVREIKRGGAIKHIKRVFDTPYSISALIGSSMDRSMTDGWWELLLLNTTFDNNNHYPIYTGRAGLDWHIGQVQFGFDEFNKYLEKYPE